MSQLYTISFSSGEIDWRLIPTHLMFVLQSILFTMAIEKHNRVPNKIHLFTRVYSDE